jgi:hypothetical protein
MKLKSISSILLAALGCGLILTLNSNSGGIMGKSTTGCSGSGCHGSKTNNTVITLSGIPTNPIGFEVNKTYTCTLMVANTNTALTKAGFDMSYTGGTITNSSGSVMNMAGELHHTAPQVMISGATAWIFNWKAPATITPVTFAVSANCVNDNGSESGDEWNSSSITYIGNFPSAVNDIDANTISIFPNPVVNSLSIETEHAGYQYEIYNSIGQQMTSTKITKDKLTQIDCSAYPSGNYFIRLSENNKTLVKHFAK